MTVRLGFACHWGQSREGTWSGTPWRLRSALSGVTEVVDVGSDLARPVQAVLKGMGAGRTPQGWVSTWRHGSITQSLVEADVRARVRRARPDVVLEIHDLAVLDTPFLVLQDLSYVLLLEHFGPNGVPHFRALGRSRIEALRARQERIYEHAAAILPMSEWMARSLVAHGVSAARVHVVNPGSNVPLPAARAAAVPERRGGPTRRLLLVGRDFDTKGGAQVVAAFERLRRELGSTISLTIAGPRTWPLRGDVPDGVTFLGPRPAAEIARLIDTHDLFVMPSRFEGFGIAFAEALVRGLPCIGRAACAMPEIIDRASGGRLVTSESPDELADLIVDTLADDALYAACAAAAPGRQAHFTWERAADQVATIAQEVRR
ncbi:MAG: glycosyltransferase family 4 protein [Cellulomonas sp.]|uniref:glycosyltransferase family 4 protein n=1 Tax=Cellulomonas sp. TaxID=40001 RepID=UPI0018203102|nr:glycosyltransferase family 4 protein [Cellulomonas sp.]NMM15821.1 glycosyltransferase family 4 protein [Cellulomonas sp.]NMM31892.1 glycosyltransferase family 4 protein [Cellulomonas sp.]